MNRTSGNLTKAFLLFAMFAAILPIPVPGHSQARPGNGPPPKGEGDTPRPEPGGRNQGGFGGFGFGIDLFGDDQGGGGGGKKPDPAKTLPNSGPQVQDRLYRTSDVVIYGFVQGGWPAVVAYKLEKPGQVWVEISALDSKQNIAPFYYRLDGTKVDKQEKVFTLPDRFGNQAQPGKIVIRTLDNGQGAVEPVPFHVYAVGLGPRAVGSVKIDQVHFQPESLHLKQKDKAIYSFHSLSDFPRVAVDVYRAGQDSQGEFQEMRVKRDEIKGGVARDGWIGRDNTKTWNGKAQNNKPSIGTHWVRVLAWVNLADVKDWCFSDSDDVVSVSED